VLDRDRLVDAVLAVKQCVGNSLADRALGEVGKLDLRSVREVQGHGVAPSPDELEQPIENEDQRAGQPDISARTARM
jgi:hypothetical protein